MTPSSKLQTERQTMSLVHRGRRRSRSSTRNAVSLAALVAFGLLGAACSRHAGEATGSIAQSPDYRERHPIVVGAAPRKLDIYPMRGASGLDIRQADDVRAFVAEYRAAGQGVLRVGVANNGPATQATLGHVRKALGEAGVSGQYVAIVHYQTDDPVAVAPVRLSFSKLQAKVDSICGQWWTDFNGAGTAETFRNQSPSNFGCAYQTSIAAQVANPIDLDRPRQETSIDVLKRSKDIDTLRQHKDPSTDWKVNSTSVGQTQ